MSGDFAHHRQLVGRMLFQGVGLKTEQRRKCQQQHDARNHHDHEGDFLSDRPIAEVLHEPRVRVHGIKSYF